MVCGMRPVGLVGFCPNIFYAVLATQAIANVVKSSFGPSGLDKMMVDDIGVGQLQPHHASGTCLT